MWAHTFFCLYPHSAQRKRTIRLMRKRTILALLALVFVSGVMANPVDPQRAIEVAQQFVPKSTTAQRAPMRGSQSGLSSSIVYTHMMPNSNRPAFYIVNVDGGAFVLVSADDIAHQVLGYSLSSTWPVSKDGSVELPEHIKGFFDDLAAQMETAIEAEPISATGVYKANLRSAAPTRSPSLPDSVGPLLTTTWDQGQYYNSLCPEDANGPGGHAQTGCVATAMAQIIKYWSDPTPGRGTHSYSTNFGTLTVNYAEASYDYASMPDVLNENSTQAQINAVSQLIYHCGVATNMEYSPSESSAMDQDARAGLINFFRFSPEISYVERASFSNEEWNNLLHNNLANNRPVYYSGKGTSGHAFICDGYKANEYYHFNFGWGGFADGWYLTSALTPPNMNYSSSQSALIGIAPDNNSNIILGQTTGMSTFIVEESLELYNLMGHNVYKGNYYNNACNNTITFMPLDNSKQLVTDIMELEGQTIQIYDGTNTNILLRRLNGGAENNINPVVSTANALTMNYYGNMYYEGFKLSVSQDNGRRMVSNISSIIDNTNVHLSWTENGDATEWQIEYGPKGFELGSGTVYYANTNTATFNGLEKFTEYDFYIRSVIDNELYGIWNKVTILVEAPYWTDIVTSKPDGYVFNELTNTVEISTAEGLAWFASVANGLNGMPHDEVQWSGRKVVLTNDLDLSEYRWMPIKYGFSGGEFDGRGHTISGIYVKETDEAGFFSIIHSIDTRVINLNIDHCNIYSTYWAGGIAAKLEMISLINCSVTGTIYGKYLAGGLAALASDCEITNCYTNCNITGNLQIGGGWTGTGGLIGALLGVNKHLKQTVIRNCYSMSNVKSPNQKGLLVGYIRDSYAYNCFGLERYFNDLFGYRELSTIVDCSSFVEKETDWILSDVIKFDSETNNNLLEVLNLGVQSINAHGLKKWIINNMNQNIPVFGDTLNVLCENVSDVKARNIVSDGMQAIEISWIEKGLSKEWEIKYGIQSQNYSEICDTMYYVNSHSNPDTIYGLDVYNGKTCIINVRPVLDNTHHGGWSDNCLLNIDYPYWTDVVTSRPEGYSIDENGNVTISDSNGLAWLISVVNGENHQKPDNMLGKTITLTSDVDMSRYRWKPLSVYYENGIRILDSFQGVFDGAGHVITGLRINENEDYVGMFGLLNNSIVKNIVLDSCVISGNSYVGCLFGLAEQSIINNCNVNATISGTNNVGGLAGSIKIASLVDHCSFSGVVNSAQDVSGGLIGSINNNMDITTIRAGEVSIINCWTNCSLYSIGGVAGGLIGFAGHHCSFTNCYSTSDITSSEYVGGLLGYSTGMYYGYAPQMINCYYAGNIIGQNSVGNIIGFAEYRITLGNCFALNNGIPIVESWYGVDDSKIERNLSDFIMEDSGVFLQTPLIINENEISDLLIALNEWVQSTNDNTYFQWCYSNSDSIRHPILGDRLASFCPPPTITVDSIMEDGVKLRWYNMEGVQSWEVEYGLWCFEKGTGSVITISDTTLVLNNLKLGEKYDIYMRSNSGKEHSKWIKTTIKPDKLYWKDVVTKQPDGWRQDNNGNIYISTPEALAWLITYYENSWEKHTVHIMNDIDISQYKWTTFGKYYMNWNIEGYGHTIKGLYIDEEQNEIAFIHTLYNSYIKNLLFDDCFVRGQAYAAIICHNNGGEIINCGVRGRVVGYQSLGGVTSINSYSSSITNTYSNCELIINSFGADFGGFCSINYGEIKNCYSSSRIAIDSAYYARCQNLGIFTGEDYSNNSQNNIAYWNKIDSVQINGVSYGGDGYYSFMKSKSSFEIINPPLIKDSCHFDLIEAFNAWVDANNAEGQYRHWESDTANVNEGYPIFAPMPKCIVTFKNVNGNTLQIDTLEYGSLPAYRGSTPTLESSAQYAYTFREWSAALTPITGDVTFTALYDAHMFGDVTDNAAVDVQDATIVVNYILGERPEGYLYHMADMNKDTVIDVFDLTAIINVILGKTSFQAPMRTGSSGYESTTYLLGNRPANIVGEEDVYLRTVSDMIGLSIANASRFTSFQMDIEVPEGAELQNVELTGSKNTHFVQKAKIGDNLYRVIALSMSSQPLADSNGELVTFQITNAANAEISVSNVMFVTPKGEAHYFNGASTMTPTIVRENTTDKDDVIFDLSGRRIYKKPEDLERGVYIINNEKVIIK